MKKRKVILVLIENDGIKMTAKKCIKCDEVKLLTEFHKGNCKGGKYHTCIECHNKHGYKRKKRGTSQVKEDGNGDKLKLCLKCKKWYPLSNFGKKHKCIEGLSPECIGCQGIRESQRWEHLKENNPEKYGDRLEKMSKYYYKDHEKNLARKRDHYAKNKENIIQKTVAWQRNNPESRRRYKANRSAMKRHLTKTMTKEQYDMVLQDWDYCCALKLSQKYEWEHFIPLSWGHGGTYLGNVYPLDRSLNYSKRHKNPFEWMNYYQEYQEPFTTLVNYLAGQNGLTPDEFREFVYWCDENRRTAEQVKADNRTSLEIWSSEKR
jgi:hypothetical protein